VTVTVVTVVVVVLVLLGLIGMDRLALQVLMTSPRAPDKTVPDTGVDHEDLVIQSDDHVLGAWLLKPPGEANAPLVLLAHGWGANYSLFLQLAEPLVADGYEVLLFDIRGHGRNEAVPFVTVRHFRDDVMAAVAYARGRFPDRPLVVIGHSLGGAASTLAAAEGAHMQGLVLIAAPSDALRATAEFLSQQKLPGNLMLRLLVPFWWRRAGSRFGPLTPTKRLPEVKIPVLIIHPENDQRVPVAHAERLSAAAGCGYELVAGAGHNDVLGHDETHRLVRGFLERF